MTRFVFSLEQLPEPSAVASKVDLDEAHHIQVKVLHISIESILIGWVAA